MSHLFSARVIQAVDEIHLVVKEGGLRDGRGNYRDGVSVQQENLHLGRRSTGCTIPGRHHLRDVAGHCLNHIHLGGMPRVSAGKEMIELRVKKVRGPAHGESSAHQSRTWSFDQLSGGRLFDHEAYKIRSFVVCC